MRFTDKPYYKQPWYNTYRSMMDRCYRNGVRGVFLLHKAEDTTFKKGYDRYKDARHYCDFGKEKNKNNNPIKVRYHEEEHTYSEWSDILGIKKNTLRSRVRRGIGLDGTYTERPTIIEAEE